MHVVLTPSDTSMTEPTAVTAAEPRQPHRLFRWLVLVFISLAMFGNYYVYDCISPLADVLKRAARLLGLEHRPAAGDLQLPEHRDGPDRRDHHRPDRHEASRRCCSARSASSARCHRVAGCRVRPWRLPSRGWRHLRVRGRIAVLASMVAGRLIFGLGAESLIVARDHGDRAVVQGQGAELRVRDQPDDRAARVVRRAQLADAGRRAPTRSWQWPLADLGRPSRPSAWWARSSTGCSSRRPSGATRWARRARPTRWTSATSSASARSYWFIVALCITFYSGIFPFQTFAVKFFIEAHGATPRDRRLPVEHADAVRDDRHAALRPARGPGREAVALHDVRVAAADPRLPDHGLHDGSRSTCRWR